MGYLQRGFRNVFRNGTRSVSIIIILALSLGLALAMFISLRTVENKIESVKQSVGSYVTISPAGIRGFEGGGSLLADSDLNQLSSVNGVGKVVKVLIERLNTGTDTTLNSAIDAGSFGQRQQQRQFPGSDAGSSSRTSSATRTFTMPITIYGANDLSEYSQLSLTSLNITAGQNIDPISSTDQIIVGKDLAIKNSLSVGSTTVIEGTTFTVAGIYDGGNTFGNAAIIVPLSTLQTLTNQSGLSNQAIVYAKSIDNLDAIESQAKNILGNKADITTSSQSIDSAIKPLENIKTITLYGLIGSVFAASVILLLSMIMIVRERRREIGILKAVGCSDFGILMQFAAESFTFTMIGGVFGIVVGYFASNPILQMMVKNASTSASAVATDGAQNGSGFRGMGEAIRDMGGATSSALHGAISNLSAVVGFDVILWGLLGAVVVAIIGSAIPSIIISKIRPAEVMRSE
ncbi:MAG: FtsX-like permease family protein [Candidatus Berkelbacteria bacterium]